MGKRVLCVSYSPLALDQLRGYLSLLPEVELPLDVALMGPCGLYGVPQRCDVAVVLIEKASQIERVLDYLRLVQAASPTCLILLFSNSYLMIHRSYQTIFHHLACCCGLGGVQQMAQVAASLITTQKPLSAAPWFQYLSPREREILQLFVAGKSTKEISYQLGISINTVATHRKNLYRKTGVTSLQQLLVAVHESSLTISSSSSKNQLAVQPGGRELRLEYFAFQ